MKLQLLHLKIITLKQRALGALLHKSKYMYVSTKTSLINTQNLKKNVLLKYELTKF